ncbi:hypothetical protein [Candidatus Ichthyocystis sparus]|uniref:hypothetical protein n=1 Tax=Candidatus Ichthyocystis sparus TaxID=1561004 RepID=UPI00114634ED|nr:hypothetical protein [Candidatus Ichthyocystis sparus]
MMCGALSVIGAAVVAKVKAQSKKTITGVIFMSDRLTRGVSDSGSSGSENDGTADVGRDSSPLGATGQDKDESSKSGGGSSPSRGSLASPGRSEPLGLGARPKERSDKRGEKGGGRKGRPYGRDDVWHKRDRKSAKCHKGRGQELAAERIAAVGTTRLASGAKNRGGSEKVDMSGLMVVRHEVVEIRGSRSRGQVDRRTTLLSTVRSDFRKYGVGGLFFIVFFFLVFMLGPSVTLVILALDSIANSNSEGRSRNGSLMRNLGCIVLVGSLAYLLVLLKIMLKTPDTRDLGSGEKDKSKKK